MMNLQSRFFAVGASLAMLGTACGGAGTSSSPVRSSEPLTRATPSASAAAPTPSPVSLGQAGFALGTAAVKVGMTYDTGSNSDVCEGCASVFIPSAVTAHVGDIVEWDFDPTAFVRHNIVFADAPDLSNYKGLGAGDVVARGDGVWQVRFTHPGIYNYVCTFHKGMVGTVTVL